ncbi:thiamine pyrophosphokinase [Parelusimicrobium proximum]|uniref:thiamine diphosphokinase n=1 Tax=Parelusimicrobium proximum TaxID=3228953 RepID=UPI003D1753A7
MKKALIICNGRVSGKNEWAVKEAKSADFVICADGGANTALALGITPDMIIGDFDSVSPKAKKKFITSKWLHVKRQDNTDFEKALDYLITKNCRSCTILFAAGGRLDFTFGNFISSFRYVPRMEITFKDKKWRAFPIKKTERFMSVKGERVSIIPFGGCKGITLKGLQYPLNDANLAPEDAAMSNVANRKTFDVILKEGNVLVYVEER